MAQKKTHQVAGQTKRRAMYGTNVAIAVIAAVAVVILLNWIVSGNLNDARFDWTATRKYSLSDQTYKVLDDLDSDYEIVPLLPRTSAVADANDAASLQQALDVIDALQPVDKDILVFKRYLSGFSYNDLEYILRNLDIDTVVIAGASTDNTVLWTAADAFQRRFRTAVLDDVTMVHRESEPPEVQTYALRIVKNVLRSDVLSLADAMPKYIAASERTQFTA